MLSRIPEIDYLKSIFILLMVTFHLSYIGDSYPYAKQIVYTFHMPGFLFLSGYLAAKKGSRRSIQQRIGWIFVPYACLEVVYTVLSHFLPVREKVATLSWSVLLEKVFLHPVGPYWYLHTLMMCLALHHFTSRIRSTHILLYPTAFGLALFGLHCCGLLSFSTAFYFLAGSIVARYALHVNQFFQPTWVVILPVFILCCYPDNLDRGSLGGLVIVFCCFSLILWSYCYLPEKLQQLSCYVGRNTFPILLFSPAFTMLSKFYFPLFSFEPTGLLFLLFTLPVCVSGSIGIALLFDRWRLSPYFFGTSQCVK